MIENKDIKTDTIYSKLANQSEAQIILRPALEIKNIVKVVLNNEPTSHFINNKEIKTGEAVIVMKNSKTDIDAYIDNMGHLIICGEDAKNYSIDNMGHLIYNFR